MEIQGTIEEIIYQNEINGYTIANFETEEEILTVVGYLPFITQGDSLKLVGKYVEHPEYGRQFKIDTFEKLMPQSKAAIEKYLAGGIIKGIGPATAKKIVEMFGEATITIFKTQPEKLAMVKGINLARAREIAEEFNEKWETWQLVSFLERFGISSANSKKVYDALGANAIAQIEENPYILIDITYGVDFKKIDRMAMQLGLPYNSDKRIESGIKYSLIGASSNGHTCVMKQNLIHHVTELLDVQTEDVQNSLINLRGKQEIVIEKQTEEEWVYLYPFYKAAENIAEKLKLLMKVKNSKYIADFQKEMKKQEKWLDIELSEKQTEAIKAVNENNVCVITGGPRNTEKLQS